jgi:hypothetical protein
MARIAISTALAIVVLTFWTGSAQAQYFGYYGGGQNFHIQPYPYPYPVTQYHVYPHGNHYHVIPRSSYYPSYNDCWQRRVPTVPQINRSSYRTNFFDGSATNFSHGTSQFWGSPSRRF